jgi:ech hydrogenase subunit D
MTENMQQDQPRVPTVENVETVEKANLLERVQEFAEQKMRFITATCVDRGPSIEVLYHFDKNLEMRHLRLLVGKDEDLPSISGTYLCAFMVENEMKELFGLKIEGLALDYQGKMLLGDGSPKLPMLKPEKPAENNGRNETLGDR